MKSFIKYLQHRARLAPVQIIALIMFSFALNDLLNANHVEALIGFAISLVGYLIQPVIDGIYGARYE